MTLKAKYEDLLRRISSQSTEWIEDEDGVHHEIFPEHQELLFKHSVEVARLDANYAIAYGTPSQREPYLSYLENDWKTSLAETENAGREAVWETLKKGFCGYDMLTLDQLREEATNAGYEDDQ